MPDLDAILLAWADHSRRAHPAALDPDRDDHGLYQAAVACPDCLRYNARATLAAYAAGITPQETD